MTPNFYPDLSISWFAEKSPDFCHVVKNFEILVVFDKKLNKILKQDLEISSDKLSQIYPKFANISSMKTYPIKVK